MSICTISPTHLKKKKLTGEPAFYTTLLTRRSSAHVVLFFILIFQAVAAAPVVAEQYPGWGKKSPYNLLYKPEDSTTLKCNVEQVVAIQPIAGMEEGVGIIVTLRKKGERVEVHLGPKSFVDVGMIRLTPGERITIKGVYAELNGSKFFMASKLKKSDFLELKLRQTGSGFPAWLQEIDELKDWIREN